MFKRRDHHDQANRQRDRDFLEPQRGIQRLVQLRPILNEKSGTELLLQRLTHGDRIVHVRQPQLHHVGPLPVQEVGGRLHRDQRVRAVDFVKVQAEDAHDLERAEARLQARPASVRTPA